VSARGQLKGRKVLVKLTDGTKFVDEFVDNTSTRIVLKEHGRIRRDFIKKLSPYVEQGFSWIGVRHPEEFDVKQAREFPQLCPLRKWRTGDGYYTCQQGLDEHGKCPEHGQVRFNPHEAAKAAKERLEKEKPTLRKEPPRRTARGRTVARMMHVRKVHGW
jgi:hypothetical protein